MKKILCAILLSMYAINCIALTQITVGKTDCGSWIKDKQNQYFQQTWLVGYVSGLNSANIAGDNIDWLEGVSAEQIFVWMDNYCTKNPLDRTLDGVAVLITELHKKKVAKK